MNSYFTEEGRGFKHWAGAQPCGYASWDEIFSEERRPVYEENFRYLDMMNELCKSMVQNWYWCVRRSHAMKKQ